MKFIIAIILPILLFAEDQQFQNQELGISFNYPNEFKIQTTEDPTILLIATSFANQSVLNFNLIKFNQKYNLSDREHQQIKNIIESYQAFGMSPEVILSKIHDNFFEIKLKTTELIFDVLIIPNCDQHLVLTLTSKNDSNEAIIKKTNQTINLIKNTLKTKNCLVQNHQNNINIYTIIIAVFFIFLFLFKRKFKATQI